MKNNNQYRGGIFDCWYSGTCADIWVEYKYGKNELSPLQKEWGKDRYIEGRQVYVIIGSPEGGVLYTTPESWEALKKKPPHTVHEIVEWIVRSTTGDWKFESKPKAIKRGKRVRVRV